jgi:hypothetical protein
MDWMPTHRLIRASGPAAREAIEVMALDMGVEYPGPGRYGLFTEEEWRAESAPEWVMDNLGRVWYQGGPPPEGERTTMEGVWD